MAIEIAPLKIETDERFDMRALWRLGVWGAGAAFALAILAFVSMSDSGSQRLALAFAPVELPVRPIATVKIPHPQDDAEARRLAAQVRTLAADRDRLILRVASLEHQLDDLTGSIKRLADIPAPAASAPAPRPNSPAATPPAMARRDTPRTIAVTSPVNSPLAMPAAGTAASWPDKPPPPQAETNAAEPADPPPKDAAAPALEKVPLPQARITTAEPAKLEFGIALAGASSIEVARLQWAAVKANFGPLLAGLEPRALSESRGAATHYRLVAGPLPTYTAAAQLCAHMIAAHATCQPVKFTGARL